MIRAAAPLALSSCFLACAFLTGCAAPGDPIARHPIVPAPVTDLSARQYGDAFVLRFTLPGRSMDREPLAERPAIEIYRATLVPGASPDKRTAWQLAYTIPSEEVDRYLKADGVEFHDPLRAPDFGGGTGASLAYKVRTREVKVRGSEDSNIVVARPFPPPEAPQNVRVEVTEPALVLTWMDAPLPPGASARAYRIYRGVVDAGGPNPVSNPVQDISQAKLKSPLEVQGNSPSNEFRDTQFEFGATYLYTVRSVAQFGSDSVESADSAPAVVTPRDVFPPAAPTGLEITVIPATPQAPAYVELSWAISPETDLAGYSVYRGDDEGAPGERINSEVLPSPSFRDTSVQPGRRYFYRVSAADRSGNESPKTSAQAVDIP